MKICLIIHDYSGYEERQAENNSDDYADHISYLSFIIYVSLKLYQGVAMNENPVYPIDARLEPSRKIGTSK